MDYADVIERLPILLVAVQEDAVNDAAEVTEFTKLKNLIPQLMRMVPDVLRDRTDPRHRAALSEMMSKLLSSFDSFRENTNEVCIVASHHLWLLTSTLPFHFSNLISILTLSTRLAALNIFITRLITVSSRPFPQ